MSSRLHVQKKEAVALRQNRDYTNKKTQIIGVSQSLIGVSQLSQSFQTPK